MRLIGLATLPLTFAKVSISNVTCDRYWFSTDRSITRHQPPDRLGTQNALEKNPVSSGRISRMNCFWFSYSIILMSESCLALSRYDVTSA